MEKTWLKVLPRGNMLRSTQRPKSISWREGRSLEKRSLVALDKRLAEGLKRRRDGCQCRKQVLADGKIVATEWVILSEKWLIKGRAKPGIIYARIGIRRFAQ